MGAYGRVKDEELGMLDGDNDCNAGNELVPEDDQIADMVNDGLAFPDNHCMPPESDYVDQADRPIIRPTWAGSAESFSVRSVDSPKRMAMPFTVYAFVITAVAGQTTIIHTMSARRHIGHDLSRNNA